MSKTKVKDMSEPIEEPAKEQEIPQPVVSTTEKEEKSPKEISHGVRDDKKKAAPVKAKQRSKKYLEAAEKVEKVKEYPLSEALEKVKAVSYTKFEGSVEIHINTRQKNLRGLVNLPYSAGKSLKVAAMGRGSAESGADVIVDDAVMADLEKGRINFDALVVTPDQMPKIARLARILGPRGLMPNPKNGTISDDLKKAVVELQGGKTEYKTQKDSQVIHLGIGKVNQDPAELEANIKTLYQALGKSRVKRVTLAPTMGVGVRVSLNSL